MSTQHREHPVPTANLHRILAKMGGCRVLVVGDLMLDRFVRGDVTRISPESPVPVLAVRNETRMIGGAGNVLANLHTLGVTPSIIATIGNDEEGRIVSGLVEASGGSAANLVTRRGKPTTIKTRFLAGHQQLLRVDQEVTGALDTDTENEILHKISELLPAQNAVILSDYGKGVLTSRVIESVITHAATLGLPVLVDPKGTDYSKYRGASVVTPNRKELAEATRDAPTETDDDIVAAASKLIAQSGIRSVVATRSQDGMSILTAKADGTGLERPVHLRTLAREVFDVSGAGDTVIATIAAALASGAELTEAAILANIAGGIVVGKVGTASIRAQELDTALNEGGAQASAPTGTGSTITPSTPLYDLPHAIEEVERWKARGLRVGFTNGCFDILHAGHVNYLGDARKQCDRLILGLNTDRSVSLLKGPSRPVNRQDDRATVLGALAAVDMIVFFGAEEANDDSTATPLIRALKPDIYFKGADYTLDRIPEVPTVLSYGGEVKLIPLTEGRSTTSIIEKIGNKPAKAG